MTALRSRRNGSTGSNSRLLLRRGKAISRAATLALEPLEQRQLLTAVILNDTADSFYVRLNSTGEYVQVYENATPNDTPTPTPTHVYDASTYTSLSVQTPGDDALTVDFTNGNPAPDGITIDNSGTLDVTALDDASGSNWTVTSDSTVNWDSGNTIGTLTNEGSVSILAPALSLGTVDNSGTLTIGDSNAVTSPQVSLTTGLTNSGSVSVESGTLTMGGNVHSDSGYFNVDGTGLLDLTGGGTVNYSGNFYGCVTAWPYYSNSPSTSARTASEDMSGTDQGLDMPQVLLGRKGADLIASHLQTAATAASESSTSASIVGLTESSLEPAGICLSDGTLNAAASTSFNFGGNGWNWFGGTIAGSESGAALYSPSITIGFWDGDNGTFGLDAVTLNVTSADWYGGTIQLANGASFENEYGLCLWGSTTGQPGTIEYAGEDHSGGFLENGLLWFSSTSLNLDVDVELTSDGTLWASTGALTFGASVHSDGGWLVARGGTIDFPAGSTLTVSSDATVYTESAVTFETGSALSLDAAVTLAITGGGTVAIDGGQSYGSGAVMDSQSTAVTFGTDAGSSTAQNLSLSAEGGSLQFSSTQHLAALALSSGAIAAMSTSAGQALWASSICLANQDATLDLADNDLILQVPTGDDVDDAYAALLAALQTGANGGTWDGSSGIVSSEAAANLGMGIGLARNADLGLTEFDGQSVDDHSILLKYTTAGDVNLDGWTDSDDLAAIAAGYDPEATGRSWSDGDVNGDGVVNAGDLAGLFALAGSDETEEGLEYSLPLGPTPESVTWHINWGDGHTDSASDLDGSYDSWPTHLYADAPATHTITLSATDEGESTTYSAGSMSITVDNAAPFIETADDQTAHQGDTVSLSIPFSDAGALDTHTATIDWGDGSSAESATVTEEDGAGTITAGHEYTTTGDFTPTVTVTDSDGDSADSSLTVHVLSAAPILTGWFAGDPSQICLNWLDRCSIESHYIVQASATADFSSYTTVETLGSNYTGYSTTSAGGLPWYRVVAQTTLGNMASNPTFIYASAFQDPYDAGPGWSTGDDTVTVAGNGTSYLGKFANNHAIELDIPDVAAGQEYTVSFDLYAIGPWNGQNWAVSADGSTLGSRTFNNYVSDSTAVQSGDPLGYSYDGQSVQYSSQYSGYNDADRRYHMSYTFTRDESAGDLVLDFGDGTSTWAQYVKWGIDNLKITPTATTLVTVEATDPTMLLNSDADSAAFTITRIGDVSQALDVYYRLDRKTGEGPIVDDPEASYDGPDASSYTDTDGAVLYRVHFAANERSKAQAVTDQSDLVSTDAPFLEFALEPDPTATAPGDIRYALGQVGGAARDALAKLLSLRLVFDYRLLDVPLVARIGGDPPAEVTNQLDALFDQLGDDSPTLREAASHALDSYLVQYPSLVQDYRAALRANQDDPEIRPRIEALIEHSATSIRVGRVPGANAVAILLNLPPAPARAANIRIFVYSRTKCMSDGIFPQPVGSFFDTTDVPVGSSLSPYAILVPLIPGPDKLCVTVRYISADVRTLEDFHEEYDMFVTD